MKNKLLKVLGCVLVSVLVIFMFYCCYWLGVQTANKEVMNSDLKPCPFCGGNAEIKYEEYVTDVVSAFVYCTNCKVKFYVSFEDSKEEAYIKLVKLWNTRVNE